MDADLAAIRQCKAGNRDAFAPLVTRYQREAFAHARAILPNDDDARDAVQEAFVDAFRALPRFDEGRPFYPWFYVILRNRCHGVLRKGQRGASTGQLTEGTCFVRVGVDEVELNDALSQLPAEQREILLLKYLDGLTYAELAERFDVPPGTVMSRLYHARERLRKVLELEPRRGDTEK